MRVFSKRLLSSSDKVNIVYDTPGTYTFVLRNDIRAKIAIVGAGQPSEDHRSSATGSTPYSYAGAGGAAFVGTIILTKGSYTVVVGDSTKAGWARDKYQWTTDWTTSSRRADAYDSTLTGDGGTLIKAGGNHVTDDTQMIWFYSGNALVLSENLRVISTDIASNGNAGGGTGYTNSHKSGGASLYQGWGQGAETYVDNYTKGYFSLQSL